MGLDVLGGIPVPILVADGVLDEVVGLVVSPIPALEEGRAIGGL